MHTGRLLSTRAGKSRLHPTSGPRVLKNKTVHAVPFRELCTSHVKKPYLPRIMYYQRGPFETSEHYRLFALSVRVFGKGQEFGTVYS